MPSSLATYCWSTPPTMLNPKPRKTNKKINKSDRFREALQVGGSRGCSDGVSKTEIIRRWCLWLLHQINLALMATGWEAKMTVTLKKISIQRLKHIWLESYFQLNCWVDNLADSLTQFSLIYTTRQNMHGWSFAQLSLKLAVSLNASTFTCYVSANGATRWRHVKLPKARFYPWVPASA